MQSPHMSSCKTYGMLVICHLVKLMMVDIWLIYCRYTIHIQHICWLYDPYVLPNVNFKDLSYVPPNVNIKDLSFQILLVSIDGTTCVHVSNIWSVCGVRMSNSETWNFQLSVLSKDLTCGWTCGLHVEYAVLYLSLFIFFSSLFFLPVNFM